jgi:hypothetical protein
VGLSDSADLGDAAGFGPYGEIPSRDSYRGFRERFQGCAEVSSLAPRDQYGHTEGGAGESCKREPGEQHAVPDDLDRLRGSNDSHHLHLGRYWDCHDQLSTDLTVSNRARGGALHDGVSGFGPVTKPQPRTYVVDANLLFVGR